MVLTEKTKKFDLVNFDCDFEKVPFSCICNSFTWL